ncbi:MAG: ABC transporter ATP-binding protein [Lachnospiraceae bacterium]|nr:ABC transporter ATP-binding protein [Lachnospiraceae bacterium]
MSIEVRNVSFAYSHGRTVLDDISFQIPDGEFVSLLGPNGVGKSTLFKCILRLLTGYSGEIRINGDDSKSLSAKELSRRIAYIPQSAAAIFNYTVRDTILMGTTAMVNGLRSPGKKEEAFVDEALERLSLQDLKDRLFTRISGGERQLVLIARALAQQAKILLMDEPTANLDYGNQLRVLEQIKALSGSGYTILQSTHNPEQAFWYADRVIAIRDGRLAADGAPADVMDAALLKALYRIDVSIENLHDGKIHVCVPKKLLE